MLTTIEEITQRLVRDFAPERIILYGSHANGRAGGGSDIDILVIKETDKRPIDRRLEAESVLSDRAIAIDIEVFTPDEVRYLFSIGTPLIEEVMEKGRLLYMKKSTSAWFKYAEEELETASLLYDHGKYKGACFHAQQCIEKGLKAFLLEQGERPPRTHDIVDLTNRVKERWNLSIDGDDAVFLNSVYRGRYPTDEGLLPYGEPIAADAIRAVTVSKIFLEHLKKLLWPDGHGAD